MDVEDNAVGLGPEDGVCPNCESSADVVTNELFSMHNTSRYFCEACRVYFG